MTSLCRHLSAQEIVNWVTTADGCVHTDDMTKLLPTSCEFVYTPPTRRDKTVSSRRRRRCVLGIRYRASGVMTHGQTVGRTNTCVRHCVPTQRSETVTETVHVYMCLRAYSALVPVCLAQSNSQLSAGYCHFGSW